LSKPAREVRALNPEARDLIEEKRPS
jgi:hypothetical protein